MEDIKQKINELVTLKQQLDMQIKEIQGLCDHVDVIKNNCADIGNYDPMDDCYWTEFECKICKKFWREDGSV